MTIYQYDTMMTQLGNVERMLRDVYISQSQIKERLYKLESSIILDGEIYDKLLNLTREINNIKSELNA